MKSKVFARRVNAARLRPVVDPFCAGRVTDPGGHPPPCPACGGEALRFAVRDGTNGELVCLACVPYRTDPSDTEPNHE